MQATTGDTGRRRTNVCLQFAISANAEKANAGFCRTDYHLATPAIAALARSEHIYRTAKFSGHAPITVDDDFELDR